MRRANLLLVDIEFTDELLFSEREVEFIAQAEDPRQFRENAQRVAMIQGHLPR